MSHAPTTSLDYAPHSTLGWLDFDAAASERVGTLLRAFEEPGTLDPLGLGSVRDAFSEQLAPGVSTIQTRLRYFLFLPWIFRRLGDEGVRPAQFQAKLRSTEAKLIDLLRNVGPGKGVQGYTAGIELSRMPSEAYWGGLRSWGICRVDMSIAEFGRNFAVLSSAHVARDDDGSALDQTGAVWAAIPPAPDGFLDTETNFDLTASEALFIGDQIRLNHPASLLAAATRFPAEAAEAELPWHLDQSRLSPETARVVYHARCVSEVVVGAQWVYNLLVAERASTELMWDTTSLQASLRAAIDDWAGEIRSSAARIDSWSQEMPAFWSNVGEDRGIPETTRRFVNTIVGQAVGDPDGFADNAYVRSVIKDREIKLKSSRARLGPRSGIESWNGEVLGGRLTFRWPTCRVLLEDLGKVEAS